MQCKFLRSTLLFGVLLIFAPLSWAQEEVAADNLGTGQDTAQTVAVRKMIYGLCKQQPGATVEYKDPIPDNSGVAPGKVCFKMEFKCKEKGSSGYSDVYQTTRKCFDQKIFEEEEIVYINGGQTNGGYVNGGDGGGGVIITHGSDFCSQGAGCGPCAGKCYKYFSKGKKKKSCIKCLEKNGYYCLASLLSGNRASCSEGSIVYTCHTCRGGGGSDIEYEVDCTVISKRRCEDYDQDDGKKRRRGDNDDCPGCRNNPYPPGTGFFNVMTGLGNLIQGVGAGVGMSGLAGVLGTRECRKWYENYNKDRIATDNPLVDWDCQKFTGAGFGMGHLTNAGFGQIGNLGGFGYNPTFPGNFAGPWGNYNPYFGAGPGGLGGLLGGGVQFGGNLNLGGGLGTGGQFGNPAFQPWFNNGANGLPYGQGQWGTNPWGGAQGQWGNNPWGGPSAGIGGPYQGNSAYWQGRMLQEQARRDTGLRYFTPQPINSSWQYMFPR